jgi:hypothetical protein
MRRYELATLVVAGGSAPRCGPAVAAFCAEAEARGKLLGCFAVEIGALNRVLVLRGFETEEDLRAERTRTQRSANPFGCGDWTSTIQLDAYAPLDWLPPVETGTCGPFYEVRSYVTRPNGLVPTIESWRTQVAARTALSPLLIAMHSLDGPPRFTHIWPYPSLEARAAIRTRAIGDGIWPPKGGAAWLTADMQSWICTPLPGSPLG